MTPKPLDYESLNENVKKVAYAVRGELNLRASELQKEGTKIIFTNVGNPHALGQKPLTFPPLCQAPFLLDDPNVELLFPADAIARARHYLSVTSGGLGAYSDSRGLPGIRKEVADFMERRDGYPSDPELIFLTDGASKGVMQILNTIIRDEKDGTVDEICKVASISLSPNVPGQIFDSEAVLESLRRRAHIMTDGFNSCRNVVCNFTEGAMYSFPQIRLPPKAIEAARKAGKAPDVFYCLKLLEATGIAKLLMFSIASSSWKQLAFPLFQALVLARKKDPKSRRRHPIGSMALDGKWAQVGFELGFGPELEEILHAGNTNKNGFKALIAAEYSGVKVELVKNFEMGVSNKTPEFLKMNPIGKVPVLETPDGPIFESNAIARYVTRLKADNPLYGSSLIEYARIEQWIDFASIEIDVNIGRWLYPRLGFIPFAAVAEESAISALKRRLGALSTHLATNTYLVGHSVTLADIIMTCNLYVGFVRIMTKSFTSEFPHVERYFWTMVNQPNFSKILGEVKQPDSVPPVQSQKKPAQPKESKPKEAKKESKKEPAKPKVQEAVEEEEAPKPKLKNPLDLLPPSKMILDEWKRLYSNTKTNFREVAIKGFWDMYDPEGYSLWFCEYKYNDENTVSFVTLNKVSGFLQRLDLARKYAFGKMLVIGSEPPYKVKGLWLFRGQEIPQFVLDECYDMELYEWTKVDVTDEAQKERVNAMIEDQEPFEGEALLDAKCFK
ncbi:putative Elongation factor 1-gamma 2 [Cocos nucifera]|uniref:Putative Elongation factor 1-gamma 2 n=1 Tax=Cocos nucifera TaxID=13894 RepID=A0A8K0N2Y4_COCNU|nr:putative Elongation factor 1-gamma 2 [Cocos nucifera]